MVETIKSAFADHCSYRRIIGVGGVGSGIFFELEGNHDLGRNESRSARLIDARDYCKLHIIMHYLATLCDHSGIHSVPVARVGNDIAGQQLISEMQRVGIDVSYVEKIDSASTLFSVCFQYPDRSGGNITTNLSAASMLNASDCDLVAPLFEEHKQCSIALAVPEVPLEVRHHFLKLATRYEAFRVASFNSAEIVEAKQRGLFEVVDLVAINEEEAEALIGERFETNSSLEKCAGALTKLQPHINIVVSAGKRGAFGFDGKEWVHSPALPVTVVSSAGAGDALLAGTLTGLIGGLPLVGSHSACEIKSAVDFGVFLASYSVTSQHTIHPSACSQDLRSFAKTLGIRVERLLGETALVN